MNAKYLIGHFDRIAAAPEFLPRLRRLIVDLAVRGKLVSQDASDEPAGALLDQIKVEWRDLLQAGKVKKPPVLAAANGQELAFPLPDGWEPTRLGLVAACLDFKRKPVNATERARRIEGKARAELVPYYGATQQQGWIDDYLFDEELVLLGEDGVPFFDDLRPKAYVISGKSWVNNHAHVFLGILVSNRFLMHWLNTFDYTGRVVGAGRSKLNQSRALDIPLALPPLSEQDRIVRKIEELMAMCDGLKLHLERSQQTRAELLEVVMHEALG